jgi:hypothetical protein
MRFNSTKMTFIIFPEKKVNKLKPSTQARWNAFVLKRATERLQQRLLCAPALTPHVGLL